MLVLFRALYHWNHAAVRRFADHVLELDCGVVDAEAVEQALFYITQNPFAHRRRDVRNRNMAGERVRLAPDTPYVQIMNIIDPFDRANRQLDFLQLHSPGSAFEQNVQRLAANAETRPKDQYADPNR